MEVKLREKEIEQKVIEIEAKEQLLAKKCDNCGKIFRMGKTTTNNDCLDYDYKHNDNLGRSYYFGTMTGEFDYIYDSGGRFSMGGPQPALGKFKCDVCSFACAHEIFFKQKWKNIEKYKDIADSGIMLVDVVVKISAIVVYEKEIIELYEKSDCHHGDITLGLYNAAKNLGEDPEKLKRKFKIDFGC